MRIRILRMAARTEVGATAGIVARAARVVAVAVNRHRATAAVEATKRRASSRVEIMRVVPLVVVAVVAVGPALAG